MATKAFFTIVFSVIFGTGAGTIRKWTQKLSVDPAMDHTTFIEFSNAMAHYIAHYLENIRDRRVLPEVQPGYLKPLIPNEAPEEAEQWTDVMADIERVIMPGITQWHSPRFHAYFPAANSYPSIVADMLSGAIGCIGFSWLASPACTELEVVMMDWLGRLVGLPDEFLASSGGTGGGVIQGTASEATFVALLGAKAKKIAEIKRTNPNMTDYEIIPKLVAYSSEQAHSSVQRAGLLGGVRFRSIPTDEVHGIRAELLINAIKQDKQRGLIPFYIVACLGTTSSCGFDRLNDFTPFCQEEKIWVHVDAAYAGASFICPEFRYLMEGVEHAESFDFNPHKWLLVNFDCSAMWLKDPSWIVNAFNVDPLYLKYDKPLGSVPDYRHWQIPLGRRFRSLKLWFVLRLYGAKNLRAHIRKQVGLAHMYEELLLSDVRFELVAPVIMGLVCFRLKGPNERSEKLLQKINENGVIHMVPSKIGDTYFLRMSVCSRYSEVEDIKFTWSEVKKTADRLLEDEHKLFN